MPRGNKPIQDNHFRKHWQERIKTWFNQPGRKARRARNRKVKAARIFPRPVSGPLRPVVHCPTIRYNMRTRLGRGFTLQEVKKAGLNKKFARTIGISVDHRRRNKSTESLLTNVARLKEYKSKLILFPRKNGSFKKGDATPAQIRAAKQVRGNIMPIKKHKTSVAIVKLAEYAKLPRALHTLNAAKAHAKQVGLRLKKIEARKEKEARAAQQ